MSRISSNYYNLGTDIAMLAPENGAYFSRNVWFGGFNTSTAKPVSAKNTTSPAIGSFVYTSGAMTGQVYGRVTSNNGDCNGKVTTIIDTDNGHTYDGVIQNGDSGGGSREMEYSDDR